MDDSRDGLAAWRGKGLYAISDRSDTSPAAVVSAKSLGGNPLAEACLRTHACTNAVSRKLV